jgi:hypothetical protein
MDIKYDTVEEFHRTLFLCALYEKAVHLRPLWPDVGFDVVFDETMSYAVNRLTQFRHEFVMAHPDIDLDEVKVNCMRVYKGGPLNRDYVVDLNRACNVRLLGMTWLRCIGCARRIQRAWRACARSNARM